MEESNRNEEPTTVDGRLANLTEQLEQLASRLKAEEVADDETARLVEECARLAGEAGAELEQLVNRGSFASPQQGELL